MTRMKLLMRRGKRKSVRAGIGAGMDIMFLETLNFSAPAHFLSNISSHLFLL